MLLARIVGNVTATRKAERLDGMRFLLARPYAQPGVAPTAGLLVAADTLGAGPGEDVLLATGRAARIAVGAADEAPIDAAVMAIVDGMEVDKKAG
ncbi:MAG TPA: EutN/CcmL family microcompartment protein [Planctomycetota bacterium]|nr:EutN/CcmL family microcompartment protein [Planctomycetota bacterium]